jgi:hypothetical protein
MLATAFPALAIVFETVFAAFAARLVMFDVFTLTLVDPHAIAKAVTADIANA